MSKPEVKTMIDEARNQALLAILRSAQSGLSDEAKLKLIRAQIAALDEIEAESE
jgi:hypothetical protein